MKALVVEDDAAIADFAEMILVEQGFTVEKAGDGKQGVEKALSFHPDLILLDLMMPGMHGLQVCELLRKEASLKGVRILICSSKSYASDIEEAMAAGADEYLTKPYGAKDLVKKVRTLLAVSGGVEPGAPAADSLTVPTGSQAESKAAAPERGAGPVTVHFWGTRGSSPAPGPDTVRYGGNTACTELRFGDLLIILDCGTGLRPLGAKLAAEFQGRLIDGHIFVGHTHWDHIQGFPFFYPFYLKQNRLSVYSVRGAGKSLERVFRGQMAADYFPVPLESLACDLRFIELEGPLTLGPVQVSYMYLNHPGLAIGFRFEGLGRSICYLSDHEGYVLFGGDNEVSRKSEAKLLEFVRGCDLLICEAQYTDEEYTYKKGWGHSTYRDVVQRALDAGVKRLSLFHHDPTHDDAMMERLEAECREQARRGGNGLLCSAAREGETLSL
ncbi:MAG TPA: hypothetical protein DD417_05210 [Elusimicrobia bacterium]|nr:hypothetical protein [Elusimicrobiota bacterium]